MVIGPANDPDGLIGSGLAKRFVTVGGKTLSYGPGHGSLTTKVKVRKGFTGQYKRYRLEGGRDPLDGTASQISTALIPCHRLIWRTGLFFNV
jgi:hypothetical protein